MLFKKNKQTHICTGNFLYFLFSFFLVSCMLLFSFLHLFCFSPFGCDFHPRCVWTRDTTDLFLGAKDQRSAACFLSITSGRFRTQRSNWCHGGIDSHGQKTIIFLCIQGQRWRSLAGQKPFVIPPEWIDKERSNGYHWHWLQTICLCFGFISSKVRVTERSNGFWTYPPTELT